MEDYWQMENLGLSHLFNFYLARAGMKLEINV